MSVPPPPHPGGYGLRPPEPPPRGRTATGPGGPGGYDDSRESGWVAVAALATGVLALAMVAWIVWEAYDTEPDGHGGDAGPPERVYALTLPDSLLDRKYALARDLTANVARSLPDDTAFARQLKPTAGLYAAPSGGGELVYQGVTSAMADPGYPRYAMLDGMAEGPGVDIAVPRRTYNPGRRGPIVCEVQVQTSRGRARTLPSCSWTDRYTQGIVMDSSRATVSRGPADIDLAALAQRVARIRDEVRVPAAT